MRICLILLLFFLAVSPALATTNRGVAQGLHGDSSLLPKSCRGCHLGMMMRLDGEEGICLNCHGDASRREAMRTAGLVQPPQSRMVDIAKELQKPYRHPVTEVSGVHRQGEMLPEDEVSAARHSECVDCHSPHLLDRDAPFRGISGKKVVNLVTDIENEQQLCYKCHGSSANLPHLATDKELEFRTTNPSFHPVEGEGRNGFVISLKRPYAARQDQPGDISTIACSDCHGSDDPGGGRGPHGSNYQGLLVEHYELEDARPESR